MDEIYDRMATFHARPEDGGQRYFRGSVCLVEPDESPHSPLESLKPMVSDDYRYRPRYPTQSCLLALPSPTTPTSIRGQCARSILW